MTAEPQGSKWVGNAGLIIGLPWDKRKSLPRDSKGFEPIEGYFDRTSSPEDNNSDSSETDTEELVRQEREKRIEAEARRRAVEDAKRNAAYLVKLAAANKQTEGAQQLQSKGEGSEEEDERTDAVDVVSGNEINTDFDIASNIEVFAKSGNGNSSEELYSPNASAAIESSPSSARKNIKLLPARLSFSGGEGEHSSDTDLSESQKPPRKPRTVGTKSKRDLWSKFSSAIVTLDSVSLPTSGSGGTIILPAKHISTTTEAPFHPTKTSTKLKDRRKQVKKKSEANKPKITSKKPISSFRMEISDSESERDEVLETLLAEDTEHFQGLSEFTKSKMATTTAKNGKSPRQPFAKKSTGNMAGERKKRKSVTFVGGSGSEAEGDFDKRKTMPVSKPPLPTTVDDVYMSFDEVQVDVHAYSPRRGGKPRTPKKTQASVAPKEMYSEEETDGMKTGTGVASQETDQYVPSENKRPKDRSRVVKTNPSTAGATKQGQRLTSETEQSVNRTKDVSVRVSETPENVQVPGSEAGSVLQDVTLVTTKSTVKQSQWFVPDMGDLPRRRRTAGTTGAKSRNNAKMGKTEQEPSSSHKDPPQAPSAVSEAFSASTTQLLGKGQRRAKEVMSSTVSPPSPPFSPPSASVSAALESSENQVEDNVVNTQSDKAGEQADTKPKRKRGRPPKSASIQATALASKQGEVKEDGMATQSHADVTHGEKAPKAKRNRGRPPKSAAMQATAVASSESELDGESVAIKGHPDFIESEVSIPKRKRGRPPKSAATQAAAVVSSESELDGENVAIKGHPDFIESEVSIPKRKKGRPPKSAATQAAAVVSSESELEAERAGTQGHADVTQGRTTAKTKSRRGTHAKSAATHSKVAVVVSSESELEGESVAAPDGTESETTLQPKKKRGQSFKPAVIQSTSVASSESERERENKTTEEQTASTVDKVVDLNPKRKRGGRQLKSAGVRPVAFASSESELDEFLETLHPSQQLTIEGGGHRRKRTDGKENGKEKMWIEPTSPSNVPSKLEQIIEELKSETRRVRRVSPRHKTLPSESKRGRGQSQKSVASQLPKSVSSESEVGKHGEMTRQNSELEKKTSPKQGRRQSLRSSSTSAPRLPTSTTSESEMEEVTEGKPRRRRSPRKMTSGTSEDQAASESENGISRPKKKRSKADRQTATINNENKEAGGSEGPAVESGVEAQYVYSDYDAGDVPPCAAHSATGDDNNVGSKDTEDNHSLEGANKEDGISGAASVDVSVLPRLNKRKRGKGSKLVLDPKSKRRKKNSVEQVPDVVEPEEPDEPADSEVYSMSTSGEGDSLEGMDITQSGGGRRYKRLRVEASKRLTPGVRRGSRTRIAPIRHWENEQVEYDTKRKSGVVLKGVLVPLDPRDEQEAHQPKKTKASHSSGGGSGKTLKPQEDGEFSPLRFTDHMGVAQEQPIVHTLSSAPCINCSGEPITEDSDAEVIIHKLKSSLTTSKGVMTFGSHGEKPRSSTRTYDMFFFVLKGKLLFQVNDQEFTLFPHSSIDIPGGCRYCIRNMRHSQAQILFSTHHIEPQPSE